PGGEVAQPGVEPVPGLGGAAGVKVLDDVRGTVQDQDHLALEFGWQNRLHAIVIVREGWGRFPEKNAESGGAGTGSAPQEVAMESCEASLLHSSVAGGLAYAG